MFLTLMNIWTQMCQQPLSVNQKSCSRVSSVLTHEVLKCRPSPSLVVMETAENLLKVSSGDLKDNTHTCMCQRCNLVFFFSPRQCKTEAGCNYENDYSPAEGVGVDFLTQTLRRLSQKDWQNEMVMVYKICDTWTGKGLAASLFTLAY